MNHKWKGTTDERRRKQVRYDAARKVFKGRHRVSFREIIHEMSYDGTPLEQSDVLDKLYKDLNPKGNTVHDKRTDQDIAEAAAFELHLSHKYLQEFVIRVCDMIQNSRDEEEAKYWAKCLARTLKECSYNGPWRGAYYVGWTDEVEENIRLVKGDK